MPYDLLVFYLFASILVFAASMMIFVRNPVHAALFLVWAFFASAGIWMLLEAEFLAIVLILVYVGAVMVLFLFVVMMLDINLAVLKEGFVKFLLIGGVIAASMLGLMIGVLRPEKFMADKFIPPVRHTAEYSNTEELGRVLYTDYVYAFEIAAVILLVAIIAAIMLSLRKTRSNKTADPGQQVLVKKEDRLRIVKMHPVKKEEAS
ncbi:MAG: NADH-quinone oxidoreductase subunit J [Gammaproteobacteria bacterium]